MSRNKYIIRLVVLLSLFLITKVNAQVFTGDLTLTTQAQVDAFNYTSVTGYVNINDAVDGDITNLNGLSELTTVGGYLGISDNDVLTNINGLSSLSTIGALLINSNASLININGLNSLSSVGGNLRIESNNSLTNITGLSNLTTVGGFLNIFNNDALTNIDGLSNLNSVGGDLLILQNTSLTDFCGLYTLLSGNGLVGSYDVSDNGGPEPDPTEQEIIDGGPCPIVFDGDLLLVSQAEVDAFNYNVVTGNLTIDEASAGNITNLDGLSELTNVGGNLVINNNSAFTSVDGLSNLSSIGGFLFFSQNASLLNLNGLSNLNSVGGDLVILQNTALTEFCGLYPLLSVGGLGGSYNVEGNAANPTQSDIIDLCKTVYVGDLTLTNQAEVDAFYYSSVTGYLIIEGGDISNLNSLLELTSVGGFLDIFNNDALTNIDGLFNLTSVASFFNIIDNASLLNINGLSNLSSVGNGLEIVNNASLTEFCGLYNLLSVGGLTGGYTVLGNGANPTQQEIINGGLCITVYVGDLILTNQAEVDAFHYSSVTGYLIIEGGDISDISNLNSLLELTSVGGLDIFNNDALTNIDGLSSLTSVGGQLSIQFNDALTNIDGLSNLNSVEDDLGILNNTALSEFCGLYNLLFGSGLGGSYFVFGNGFNPTELEIINGGPCITVYVGNLTLTNQAEVDAFHYSSVTGYLSIDDGIGGDIDISNLNSLLELTSVGDALDIFNNDALTNIDGLSNLTSVASFFNIIGNASLLNINGLSNLNSVEGDLGILNNTALSEFCGLYNLLFRSGLGGSYIVSGNGFNPTELEIINGGPCTTDASENENGILPDKYDLHQNYPNPFNPSTVISWQLPSRSNVVLKVYDILGNEVATLLNENKEAGYYETKFDGSALTTGLYIYRLTAGDYLSTKKMLMIK